MSQTYTTSTTFTITNARYLSSKVAADMHLCAQYYGRPSGNPFRMGWMPAKIVGMTDWSVKPMRGEAGDTRLPRARLTRGRALA
jgi:hypothetical protein